MQMRKAKLGDLEQVLRLYQQLNPSDLPLPSPETVTKTWNEILVLPHVHLYVAERERNIVCTCVLTIIPNLSRGCAPYGLVENVVTDQEFRRQGFASELLKFALREAWKTGCYKVMLLTGSKRPETLRFYEKTGFRSGEKTGFVAYPESK